MGKWLVSEQSIFDEETGEEIIETSEWHMREKLQKICDEHNYNEVYKKFIVTLSKMLLEEIDKDGYCRMVVSKQKVIEVLESLPNHN